MFWIHLLVVLVFIFIGARKGGIAIGFAGGAGVLARLAEPAWPNGASGAA